MLRVLWCFVRQLMLLVFEAPAVFLFMWLLRDKRMPEGHPWQTGEFEGESVWGKNILYRSPSRLGATLEDDEAAVSSIGRFLASMVGRSCVEPEIPQGPKRRMPHAVNFLHGAIHHNGVFVVLDDFEDLRNHLTDRRFRREILAFGRREKREVTIVFRNRKYDPVDFAFAVGSVRAHLPWFSNGNGPTKRPVLWGNMSPYPAVATINGAWMGDLWKMVVGDFDGMVRAPIAPEQRLVGPFVGRRTHPAWIDRFLAWFQYQDVRSRGFRGQIFFSDRRKIEPHRVGEYREAGGYWKWTACHEVPAPDFRSRQDRREGLVPQVSVVIPTLNEAGEIGGAIRAARHFLGADEVVVADGGSSDETVVLAREAGALVVECGAGRGTQCAAGADLATGNVLVFLHADARVLPGARRSLDEAFGAGTAVATFTQQAAVPRKRYRLLDLSTRLDTVFTRFGDQGIAVRRDFYDELGEMPRVKLFEDVHFLRMARRRGPIERLDGRIEVSSRAFERIGVVRYMGRCMRLFAMYFAGVPHEQLWDAYYGGSK